MNTTKNNTIIDVEGNELNLVPTPFDSKLQNAYHFRTYMSNRW